MRLNFFLFLLINFIFFNLETFAQKVVFEDTIAWQSPIPKGLEGENTSKVLYFSSAQYEGSSTELPFYYKEIDVPSGIIVTNVDVVAVNFVDLESEELSLINPSDTNIKSSLRPIVHNSIVRKQNKTYVKLYPFVRGLSGQVSKVNSFELEFTYDKQLRGRTKSLTYKSQSALSSGEWYKIASTQRGVYKLTKHFLQQLGVDVDNVDPRTIRLFGHGGGMLPESNSTPRPDDLVEMAIEVKGESDGSFDAEDYVAFYGESQVKWTYNENAARFEHEVNRYCDTVYYFINVGGSQGKRIATSAEPTEEPNVQVESYIDYDHHELNQRNLLHSGQLWLGEVFDNQLNYEFNFNFPGIIQTSDANVEVATVARSGVNSTFTISSSGESAEISHDKIAINSYEAIYAHANKRVLNFTPNSGLVKLNVKYNKTQLIAKGWLDYININVMRNLTYRGETMFFRNINSIAANNVSQFNINSNRDIQVWDVTDGMNVTNKETEWDGSKLTFVDRTEVLKEYVAFENFDSTAVVPIGQIRNQNLHGMSLADMIIVTNPLFKNQAEKLADLHRQEGLKVNVATTTQVYNEFSSGAQDPIAIRTFAKMFYDRATSEEDMLKYLLIFGDASYDFKDRIRGNTNFVVSYQSKNSFNPVLSYVSDDYMALLDDNEGLWPLHEKIDLGVGRLPVKSVEEAEGVVNKIQKYYSSASLGDWRNNITFIGDEGDGRMHMDQSNRLAKIVENRKEGVNINKIFLDAYRRESTPSGTRYPTVNKAIDRAVLDGSFIVNYTGHGGETGWSANRVLDIPSILAWDNINRLAIFMTATCEFGRFDDPVRTSGGELVLLNPNGGGVALLTTTRLVFAFQNYNLNVSFYNRLLDRNPEGEYRRLGEIARRVKNDNSGSLNTRNFSLLGDPALKLAIPDYNVITESVNSKLTISVDSANYKVDTVNALSEVVVKGFVTDFWGEKLENFNGLVYPTVFDKKKTLKTLGNGGATPFTYQTFDARIFKGKATVRNGEFEFKFVVPKDISYDLGKGRITYYSDNNYQTANGEFMDFVIGGSNDSSNADNNGPEIDLYLNDRSFVYGGITNDKPVLLADLSDELGLNTVGSGIGHDIIAIIDENTENTFVLNDYYEANVDDYKSGEIRFPMEQLSEGKHTLTLKAWDVANNSSEKSIEFSVVNEKDIEIDNLVNYPNPFTTNTEFIFQHNQPGIPLDVKLEIFTVSGKLVKSFDQIIVNEGFLSRDIRWNGRDEYGDRIGKGVYLYKLKVRSGNGSTAEKIEKLVIL